jgi:biopolymer transport protein ExbD
MTLHTQKSYRPLRLRRRPGSTLTLRFVPMIDIIFQLLIFFMLGANFRGHEGFLPAELPRQVVHASNMELEPLVLRLTSSADGSCRIDIGSAGAVVIPPERAADRFTLLSRKLQEVLHQQGRSLDDPVKLVPTRQTRWDHVVKAYDALWQLNLRNIVFTMVD